MQYDMLQGLGVAITRPIDQAKPLAALLNQVGSEVIDFPLIAIAPIANDVAFEKTVARLDDTDWIIFISSNAVHNGMPSILNVWPTLPNQLRFAAIGPVTAKALNTYGVAEVLIPAGQFDSESLLTMPAMQVVQGKKVVIVRGLGGREILANTLKTRGAHVTFAECYQRVNPQENCVLLAAKTNAQQCHAVVVTSSEAMRHLIAMAAITVANAKTHWLATLKICVNHQRVAQEASGLGLQLFVADAPGDEAMLICLNKALKK